MQNKDYKDYKDSSQDYTIHIVLVAIFKIWTNGDHAAARLSW